MKAKNTGRLALAGVFTALAVVFLLLTASPLATVGLAALAGVCGIPVVVEWGRKAGLIHFAAVAMLALLLVPTVEGKTMYTAFFGWYTVFKGFVENRNGSRILEWGVKIGAFAAAVSVYGILWIRLWNMPRPDWFALWMIPVAGVVLCAVFAVYDIGLTRLISGYCERIHPKIRQAFRF